MQTKRWSDGVAFDARKLKGLLVAVLWLLAFTAAAQNADPLERAKLDIWTETAAFVYRDAKMEEPEEIANASSMQEFVEAIRKADSKSSIYSKLYQPIEQTGTYRRGQDAKAQLDLLIKSINSKLRENEQRMADINRRNKLNDLFKQLQQIASDYGNPTTPSPTAVAPAGGIGDPDNARGLAQNTAVSPRGTADSLDEENYAENQLSSIAKREGVSRRPDAVTIAALVLGLLNLALIYFLFKGINKLNLRMDQRKKELDALSLQFNTAGVKTVEGSGKMTMSAIESLVHKAVAKELAQKKAAPVTEMTGPAAVGAAPAVVTREQPLAEPAASPEEAPAPVAAAPVPEPEPEPEPENEIKPTPAPAPAPEKPVSFFARVPVNGGFHEQDLYPSPQHDSIYEIRLSRRDPNKAAFRIVTNTSVHRSAIESAYLSLKDACNYQMNNQHATRIVTDEPGTLTFQNGFWQIDRKAQVHFE